MFTTAPLPKETEISPNDIVREGQIQPSQMKRASVPIPEGPSSSEKLSLVPDQSRHHSWAFFPASNITPPAISSRTSSLSLGDDDCDRSSRSSGSTAASTPSPSPIPPSTILPGHPDSLKDVAYKDIPDQELLRSLATFLTGSGSSGQYDDNSDGVESAEQASIPKACSLSKATTETHSHETCDLVVTIRDFAYPRSHPYHYGNYPPEPVHEESEDDEEEFEEEELAEDDYQEINEGEDERTCGHARGLYDFDAESSTELTFKEGDYLWIHCRQFPGWFLGEMNGARGLVPSNYVEMI
ncbi:hypothetical protein BGX21_005884 [Mortierella sp. AD011]|nr:hypothetical protein BGX20_004367 [Mortierella sp. AD010]KAF9399635.1 hypothetical protein BGX21_005884 [Mortierella sp. AD011]